MAQEEHRRQPGEAQTKTTTGGNRWLMIGALWVPLLFTLSVVYMAFDGQHARDLDAKWVLHTVEVKDQVEHLDSLVRDVGAGERGYLLTGDVSFLPLYQNAIKEIPTESDKLAQLIEDNPRQVTNAAHLRVLIAEKLLKAAQALSRAQQEKIPENLETYRDTLGKPLNDDIRLQVEAMTTEEDRLLSQRENEFASKVEAQKDEMIGLVAVEIILIVGLTLLLLRSRKLHLTAAGRIDEAHAMTDQAQAGTLEAIARTARADVRTAEANTRTEQAEATTTLLSTCVSHLNDIVLITEADSMNEPGPKIVFANEAFERMTGYTPAETLGRSPRFLQGPKTDRRVLDEIHQAVAQRKPIRRQIINYRKDDSEFWLDIEIVPVFDAAGKCTHFVGIERDVTEQARMEQALRESESKFRLLAENISDVFWLASPDLEKMYYVSPAYDLIWGFSAQSLYAYPYQWSEAILPEDRERVMVVFGKLMQKEPSVSVEYRILRPDGGVRWIHDRGFQVRDAKGELTHITGIATDITERKRADEESRQQQTELRVLFDLIPAMVWFKDTDNHILRVNKRVAEAAGKSVEEIEGKPSLEIYPNEAGKFYEDDLEVIRSGVPKLGIVETLRKREGEDSWVQTDKIPYRDQNGNVVGIVVMAQDISARRRTEEAQRASDARYRTLFDYAPDGILIVSPENIYIDANVSICNMLGYTRDELIGLGVTEIVAETDHQRIDPALSVIRGNTDHHREWKFRHKDGSIFEVDAFSTVMPDGNVLAMIRDITDRNRNEARFRRLVDSNAQGVMFWNNRGEITGANDAFLQLVHYTREDLEAGRMNWTAMTPPEYADLDRRGREDVAAHGVSTPIEKEFIRKDGARVSILIGTANFEDNPEEGVAFVLDLTERKRAAELIAEQAALLDEAQDAIIVRDLEGKVIFWNKGAERMYGWTRQEVVGVDVSGILFANSKRFAEVNALTLSQGKWSGDLQHLTKDKSEITIEARWTLIRDKEGRPKSVLAINTDITEKKKIEAQFMRAQRMESIGTLAGGIAHDLNNILAPIMMSIDILKLTVTDPQGMSILDTIEVSSRRGSDIVRQVLSFARGLEGERVEIQPTHLLRDLESIIKNTFPKNIRLQFAIPNDTWLILGDPTQVHQILLNLCVNARDAMPNGGDLTIAVENCELDEQYAAMNIQAEAGRYVNISVTDSGTGIPQDVVDKIFDPFFTTKEINEGTGLGLSTVMTIVKSHGGIINVYSEAGKGTTFKVYLPAMELSAEAQQLRTQQISVPRGKDEMVLVIDDEASILTITSQTLLAFGYRVLTATDGAEGVAVYAQHKNEIAAVLTDMSMPIMDGAAVVRALTKINPAIKIIAASGLNANGEAARISGTAVKHFLTKPYTAGTLLTTMRATLDDVQTV